MAGTGVLRQRAGHRLIKSAKKVRFEQKNNIVFTVKVINICKIRFLVFEYALLTKSIERSDSITLIFSAKKRGKSNILEDEDIFIISIS